MSDQIRLAALANEVNCADSHTPEEQRTHWGGTLRVGDVVEVEYSYGWMEGRVEGFRAGLPGEDFQRIDVSHGPSPRSARPWRAEGCHPKHVRLISVGDDPRDITIRTLKAEVERLAGDLARSSDRLSDLPAFMNQQGCRTLATLVREVNDTAITSSAAARALLARLSVFAFLVLLALPAFAAQRHVTRPISTITVKVVAHEAYMRGQKGPLAHAAWRITTLDLDSCTVWVDTTAPDVSAEEVGALRACRKAIDGAVDAAAEKGGV